MAAAPVSPAISIPSRASAVTSSAKSNAAIPLASASIAKRPPNARDDNYVDIDPTVKDIYGIPAARIHFAWDKNTLLMWEHAKHATEQLIRASGGEYLGAGEIDTPGTSLHETGTLRMGNDPKKFVTDRFGRTHDVPNLYICDASVFPNCTDKTTTISILAFSLRSSEHLIEQFKTRSIA